MGEKDRLVQCHSYEDKNCQAPIKKKKTTSKTNKNKKTKPKAKIKICSKAPIPSTNSSAPEDLKLLHKALVNACYVPDVSRNFLAVGDIDDIPAKKQLGEIVSYKKDT